MGLSVTAYKNLVMANGNEAFDEDGELKDDDGWVQLYIDPSFPGLADEIQDCKAYQYEDSFDFHAGSYCGYNYWRELLASMAGLGDLEDIWANPPQSTPFVELVNFSDCEGTIGAAVSAKLANDFLQFQALADQHNDEWFREKYAYWRKAFETASNNGAVVFH